MARDELVDWLAGIVFGGVAITTTALQAAADGQELTFTQWRAIVRVGEQEDGCRVGEVAARLNSALPATSRLLPQARVIWWALAALVAVSRVYVGAHWPSDVVAGALIGFAMAWFALGGRKAVIPSRAASALAADTPPLAR